MDLAQRNDFLRTHGARVEMTRDRGDKPSWSIDTGDIVSMLEAVNPEYGEQVLDEVAYTVLGSEDPDNARAFLTRRRQG